MADVFISYSRSQRERVRLINEKLERLKLTVWFDASLRVGESFSEEIKRELDEAKAVLVCWERRAFDSDWVKGEAMIAHGANKYVPCFLQTIDLGAPFNVIQTEDLSAWQGEDAFSAWLKILERIGSFVGRPGLSDFSRIMGEGGHQKPLLDWIRSYPNDPLALEVQRRIGLLETESATERLQRERRETKLREAERRAARKSAKKAQQTSLGRTLRGLVLTASTAVVFFVGSGLAVYSWSAVQNTRDLFTQMERAIFETRRNSDYVQNRVATQSNEIERLFDHIRREVIEDGQPVSLEDAQLAADYYLKFGGLSFEGERIIAHAALASGQSPLDSLIEGVAILSAWDRSGDSIELWGTMVPEPLRLAQVAFERASAEQDLSGLAALGQAKVQFIIATSSWSNYSEAECERLFALLNAEPATVEEGPISLYWRGQCNRKLGLSKEAIHDYAKGLRILLNASAVGGDDLRSEQERLELQYNLLHGLGAVLTSAFENGEDDALKSAREYAEQVCLPGTAGRGSPKTRLAFACYEQAISIRRKLNQTHNQISGTEENITFLYLHDGELIEAYKHASEIARTGLFAWNELLRAIASEELGLRAEALQSRRNVALFSPYQFNLCEFTQLLPAQLADDAVRIVSEEHPRFSYSCKK